MELAPELVVQVTRHIQQLVELGACGRMLRIMAVGVASSTSCTARLCFITLVEVLVN
jgi:hypothetical protein